MHQKSLKKIKKKKRENIQYYFYKILGLLHAKFVICRKGLITDVWMSAIAYKVAVWDRLVTSNGVCSGE